MNMTKRELARLDTIIGKLDRLRCQLRERYGDDENDMMVFLGDAAISLDEAFSKASREDDIIPDDSGIETCWQYDP